MNISRSFKYNGWFLTLVAATIATASGLSWHFFLLPLNPWSDQGATLQAAIRLTRGLGLTNVVLGTDITQPSSMWLVSFPPGYSLLVAALLKAGLNVVTAVKFINAGALLLGSAGWIGLAVRHLPQRGLQVVYCGLLLVSCGALVPKGGTMDYILWAAMPYWLSLMLSLKEPEPRRSAWQLVCLASALVTAMIGIRWAAAVLVPAGCLILAWDCVNARHWRGAAARVLLFALPPTLFFLFLGWFNRMQSGAGSTVLSFMEPHWQFDKLLTSYPLETLTTIPMGLEPLLKRVWRLADPQQADVVLGLLFSMLVPVILLGACIWYRTRIGRGHPRNALDLVVVISVLVNIGFLAFLSARYTWASVNWSYLDEGRYFRPFLPAAALWWLWQVERVGIPYKRLKIGIILLMAVAIGYSFQAHVRWEFQYLTKPEPSIELASKILALQDTGRTNVVFDIDISKYVISARSDLLPFLYPGIPETEHLIAARPADVWIVRRIKERTPYWLDPDFDLKRFNALRTRFNATSVWVSSDGEYEIYHAQLAGE